MSVQQFSSFHDAQEKQLKDWHAPYAKLLVPTSPILDLGCGPGYFSEVVRDLGGTALGIDLDPTMVALAKSRGNDAVIGDHRLEAASDSIFGAVHVSHVVEHLWGDQLVDLLHSARRVLKPDGLLVIRTPNWQNPRVREFLFWMDHTHKRPYPSELLGRMVKDIGFETLQQGHEPNGMNDTFFVARRCDNSNAPKPRSLDWKTPPLTTKQRLRLGCQHFARRMIGV